MGGINKILAMDDNLLWTATGSSTIKRWRVPQRRIDRAAALILDGDMVGGPVVISDSPTTSFKPPPLGYDTTPRIGSGGSPQPSMTLNNDLSRSEVWLSSHDMEEQTTLYGIPYQSLVRLTSPNDPFTFQFSTKARDAEVATLYSAASFMSVPRHSTLRSPQHGSFQFPNAMPKSPREEVNTARADYEEREVAADASPLNSTPDEVVAGEFGLVRSIILSDRIHALTVDTAGEVAVWDIVRAVCRGKYCPEEVEAASNRGSTNSGSHNGHDAVAIRSPREALEVVRERIEGEAVVNQWASVDTKTGVLTVHVADRCFEAEVYADEVGLGHDRHFSDDVRCTLQI